MKHIGTTPRKEPIILLGIKPQDKLVLFVFEHSLAPHERTYLSKMIKTNQNAVSLMAVMSNDNPRELGGANAGEYFFRKGQSVPSRDVLFADKDQCQQWTGGTSYWNPKLPDNNAFIAALTGAITPAQSVYSDPPAMDGVAELDDYQKRLLEDSMNDSKFYSSEHLDRKTSVADEPDYTARKVEAQKMNMADSLFVAGGTATHGTIGVPAELLERIDLLVGTVHRQDKKIAELNTSVRSLVRAVKKAGGDMKDVVTPAAGDND